MHLIASTNLSYCAHHAGPQSSYDIDPSFLTSSPVQTPYGYGAMPTMFADPFTFGPDYSQCSFEVGGSSTAQQQGFHTPQQPIPPVQSPVWDLNTPPNVAQSTSRQEHDDTGDEEEEEPQLVHRRPQRVRRRPRCGTGSHYFGD